MLFIFVSGYREKYRAGALNALGAPRGSHQTFEYSLDRNVRRDTAASLADSGEPIPALIVYIDRYDAQGYRYYPIRYATLVRARSDAVKAYVTAALGELPSANALANFDAWSVANLPGSPRLSGDPENVADGMYIMLGESLPGEMLQGEPDWEGITRALGGTTALATTPQSMTVFARATVANTRTGRTIDTDADTGELLLKTGTSYRLRFQYYFPLQVTDPTASIPYEIKPGSTLTTMAALTGVIGADRRTDDLFFSADLFPASKTSGLTVSLPAQSGTRLVRAPTFTALARISFSWWFWGGGILFVIAAAALGGFATQSASEHPDVFKVGYYVAAGVPVIAWLGAMMFFGKKQ